MEKEEIIEGNKLIAEFDKYEFKYTDFFGLQCKEPYLWKNGSWTRIRNLEYHSSWDWLMSCIRKIRTIDIITNINYNIEGDFIIEGLTKKEILNFIFNREDFKSDIEMCWCGVVEFIKWYNNNENDK